MPLSLLLKWQELFWIPAWSLIEASCCKIILICRHEEEGDLPECGLLGSAWDLAAAGRHPHVLSCQNPAFLAALQSVAAAIWAVKPGSLLLPEFDHIFNLRNVLSFYPVSSLSHWTVRLPSLTGTKQD